MERVISSPKNNVITGPKSKLKNTRLENILKEYCLKRNSFNPSQPSPNIFMGKLEIRMKKYYNNLYNSNRLLTE